MHVTQRSATSVCTGILHGARTYLEVLAGDGQEEDGKRGHNAEDDKDGEDKELHVRRREAGLTTEATNLGKGGMEGYRQ